MTDDREVKCSDCGAILDPAITADAACEKCGSNKQNVKISFQDKLSIKARGRLEGKVKDNTYPRKKKIRKEFIQGFDQRISKGDYVYKERDIDRDNDTYREHITEETGEVIRSVTEKLSDHYGHGSAKFKKDSPNREEDK
ncbi:hypothetical protein [Acetobacter thailandicus]|uniref:hypothetical protein n=1 Tax=Acetobacter thailandicus TaxID=1502842 RepID=UPI001BAB7773|nr:hypothetical protein [Acetobacter thailandicus]MBS0980745.1 hypothetical protein [Acetobacter thailandicus]